MKNKVIALALTRPRTAVLLLAGLALATALATAPGALGKPKKSDHGFLGVKMQKLTSELREGLGVDASKGVLVTEVIEDSPAEKAGLEEGDVIIKIDGHTVTSPSKLRSAIREKGIGDEVAIVVQRDDETKEYKVTLGEWPDDDSWAFVMPDGFRGDFPAIFASLNTRRLGVRIEEMNEDLADYFGVDEGEGVLVLSVDDESAAGEAGMKAGDVIVSIQGEDVNSAGDIREAISDLDDGDTAEIKLIRKKKEMTLEAEIKEGPAMWDRSMNFWRGHGRSHPAPSVRIYQDDLREEVDKLREEIDELRKELRESKDE